MHIPGAGPEAVVGIVTPDFGPQDLQAVNTQLAAMDPLDRLHWARGVFGQGLYATTSAGRDAALLWDVMDQAGEGIGVTFANTGFLHPDTVAFRDTLMSRFDSIPFYECGPSETDRAAVAEEKLWRFDPDRFMQITKLDPLDRLSKGLGTTALMSAIHADQTPNRASLDYLTRRPDGTYRMHPFFDWTEAQVRAYIEKNDLPSNQLPLLAEGVEHRRIVFLDGVVELIPITECGLHIVEGKTVRKRTAD